MQTNLQLPNYTTFRVWPNGERTQTEKTNG